MATATLEVEGSTGPSASLPLSKPCSKCGVDKPLDMFHGHATTRSGKSSWCKDCQNAAARVYGTTPAGRRTRRGNHLRRTFGITLHEYEAMVCSQKGLCAICECRPKSDENLHVDHDHRTGEIRGLLCRGCNTGIGLLRDSSPLLLAAVAYLTGTA